MSEDVTLLRSGTVWLAKHGAGLDDYLAFDRSVGTVLATGYADGRSSG